MRSVEALLSILYNGRSYHAFVQHYNFTPSDLLNDLLEHKLDNFETLKRRLRYMRLIENGTVKEDSAIGEVPSKSTMKKYWCDFSSIVELGLYVDRRTADRWIGKGTGWHYTLDLDKEEYNVEEDLDDPTLKLSIRLDRQVIERELATEMIDTLGSHI